MSGPPVGRPADEPAPFRHRNLPLLLLQARESVIANFRPILHAHGLTEQQWRVVRLLLESGPLEPRQIGQQCRISSPSLAGVLARMDELGLVRRVRLAEDQRRVKVSLTARSRGLAAAMAPKIEAVYEALEAHIGRDFIDRFYAALAELIGMLGELPPVEEG
ncbi:MAG: homoprotocatechuate degradation operon regulator HpaR [Burkholderiales bacterium]|nr:homoprotocatechuate degradation operon regulator HpaR [Burkholderiales bacterium]